MCDGGAPPTRAVVSRAHWALVNVQPKTPAPPPCPRAKHYRMEWMDGLPAKETLVRANMAPKKTRHKERKVRKGVGGGGKRTVGRKGRAPAPQKSPIRQESYQVRFQSPLGPWWKGSQM
jgi:hypothetical protein